MFLKQTNIVTRGVFSKAEFPLISAKMPCFLQERLFPFLPFLHLQPISLPGPSSFVQGGAIGLSIPDDLAGDAVNGLGEIRFLQLTLPDNDDAPTLRLQLSPDFLIPLLVASHVIPMQRIIKMLISLFR